MIVKMHNFKNDIIKDIRHAVKITMHNGEMKITDNYGFEHIIPKDDLEKSVVYIADQPRRQS